NRNVFRLGRASIPLTERGLPAMPPFHGRLLSLVLTIASISWIVDPPKTMAGDVDTLSVFPPKVLLEGNFARGQLLVRRVSHDGDRRASDLTTTALFRSSSPAVAT